MDDQLSRFYLPLYKIKNIKYCSVSFRSTVPFIVLVLICVFVFAFAVHISCHVMFTRRAHCRSYMLVYANYMLLQRIYTKLRCVMVTSSSFPLETTERRCSTDASRCHHCRGSFQATQGVPGLSRVRRLVARRQWFLLRHDEHIRHQHR